MDARISVTALCLAAIACGGQTTSPVGPSTLGADGASSSGPNGTPVTTSTVTPIPGRLAFSSDRDGTRAIYIATGLELRRLASGDRPKWSPNGAQLVFQAASPGTGIFIINADGSGQRYIGQGIMPSWSPDGTRVVFSYGDLSGIGLYVMNVDGANRTKIVDGDAISASPETPVWSPDGRTIAFIRANYNDPWQLHLVAVDGSSLRPLLHPSGGIFTQDEPEWSLDGSQIVFHSFSGITVSNADGSLWQVVAPGRTLSPDWMAGGFVYAKYTGAGPTLLGGWEHRIFAIEGGMERQLIPDVDSTRKYMDSEPDWTH